MVLVVNISNQSPTRQLHGAPRIVALNITRTVKQMVADANEHVEEISIADARDLHGRDDVLVSIDIRDIREVAKTRPGIAGARQRAACGMPEMWIDPDTPYHREFFARNWKFISLPRCVAFRVGCQNRAGHGINPAAHLEGGINAWIEAGGPIDPPRDNS